MRKVISELLEQWKVKEKHLQKQQQPEKLQMKYHNIGSQGQKQQQLDKKQQEQ